MITSRTPLRISFAGGGTDLKAYYERERGAVLSTTIDRYVYINVIPNFDGGITLKYSKTENQQKVDNLEHPLFRETMKFCGVTKDVELTSIADIPTRGSGLGSSSTFTVGTLNALYAYKGLNADKEKLAKEACEIEIERIGEPIGKQDQYAAAYGGLNLIEFDPDESVKINPVKCSTGTKGELSKNTVLFYTGISRRSSSILTEQRARTKDKDKFAVLTKLRDISYEMRDRLREDDLDSFGELLNKGWELKRDLVSGITNPEIDSMYKKARKAGALGGKISGAGGGGFLMLYCEKEKQDKLGEALKGFKELRFKLEPRGSEIVLKEGINGPQ